MVEITEISATKIIGSVVKRDLNSDLSGIDSSYADNDTFPSTGDEFNITGSGVRPKGECWETGVGQELAKLIVFDMYTVVLSILVFGNSSQKLFKNYDLGLKILSQNFSLMDSMSHRM